jgi:hypothetical protein
LLLFEAARAMGKDPLAPKNQHARLDVSFFLPELLATQ